MRVDDPLLDPEIELVVIQSTPFCNIDCSYCYLPGRNTRGVVAQDTVARLFEQIFASGWAAPRITAIWHAGEPLVVPTSFYREAFAAIERLRPPAVEVIHSVQTNGTLIDDAWCDLFRDWRVRVGVSIDGPAHLHDEHRRTRSGAGTFDRTIRGVRTLRRNGIPFHVITVLAEASLDAADELVAFYEEEGIENVCFNVEESEGDHVSGMFEAGDVVQHYRAFLERFWELASRNGHIRFIREIESTIAQIFRPVEAVTRNVQVDPFGMVNVDWHGNVSTFSPELLGLENPAYDNYLIGNIHRSTLAEMRKSPALLAMARDIGAGVEACRASCEYFSVCGGGAPVNKLAENGSFDSTRTRFCELTRIAATDLVLEHTERLARSWQAPPHHRLAAELVPGAHG